MNKVGSIVLGQTPSVYSGRPCEAVINGIPVCFDELPLVSKQAAQPSLPDLPFKSAHQFSSEEVRGQP